MHPKAAELMTFDEAVRAMATDDQYSVASEVVAFDWELSRASLERGSGHPKPSSTGVSLPRRWETFRGLAKVRQEDAIHPPRAP